ncbi:MAG: hypothetical protein PHN45_00720 [Methylococcales bacterium]|nr:hypothetical protein [Methylococcales bacterium]MDD5753263.1 hypothetical protein [Methylococcales bacterium]
MSNYWAVGANHDGDNLAQDFYLRGYWEMGYSDKQQPVFAKRRDSIKKGDRIAVKTRDGRGARTISIKAIGIVKDVADGKVYIDWKLTDIVNRHVPCKGFFKTIHGPITDVAWINEAFCL